MAGPEVTVCLLAILIPLAFINCQDPTDLPFLGTRPPPPGPEFGGEDREHDDRLSFPNFGSFGSVSSTSCNYTAQAGKSCLSCTQLLNCGVNNTGTLTTCHGWFRPYCNSGFCSRMPGEACLSTTSSTTTPATGK